MMEILKLWKDNFASQSSNIEASTGNNLLLVETSGGNFLVDLSHCLCCTNFEGILKAPIKIPVLMSQPSLVTLCLPTCHGFQQTMSPLMWGMSRHGPTYHMTLSLTPGLSDPMYTLLFTPLVPISPQHPRYDNITYWLRDSPCSWISAARVRSSIIFSAFQSMSSCIITCWGN